MTRWAWYSGVGATVIYVWLLILIQQDGPLTVKTPGNVYATSELCFAQKEALESVCFTQKEALESQHYDWVPGCDRKELVVK